MPVAPRNQVIVADCLSALRVLPDCSVDSIVTDPPYGLTFMHQDQKEAAKRGEIKAWRVVNTGAVHQGGRQRMGPDHQRRLAKDARAFQEWAEEWAREACRVLKPGGHMLAFGGTRMFHRLIGGVEDAGFEIRDVLMWLYGSGFPRGKNLDGAWDGWGTELKPAYEPIVLARKSQEGTLATNVGNYGTGALNIAATKTNEGRWPSNTLWDEEAAEALGEPARFFYVAKPDRAERSAGLGENLHPTVKPMDLMRQLVCLVTPPGGLVLDPFLGSGTTACAAALEGFDYLGIEVDPGYADIAVRRIAHWTGRA